MLSLTANEARVLGTLIEKAQTVPGSYPMTLNGLTTGCNQKNNRLPVTELDEDTVFDALDSLRRKGLVREVDLSGSRVQKFRHVARESLNVGTEQLVLLAELLLRGPQALGELRGHAARMVPGGLDSMDVAQGFLDELARREPPMVKLVPPPPGGRASLYVQLLAPDLHDVSAIHASETLRTGSAPVASAVEARLAALEAALAELRARVERLGG